MGPPDRPQLRGAGLAPDDRVVPRPAATRAVGDDLLVALPDPDQPVERLGGSGPFLYRLFERGASLGEAIDAAAAAAGVPAAEVAEPVHAFVTSLAARGIVDVEHASPGASR